MIGSWWMWLAGGVAIGGMRWAIADFVLDRFGSRRLDWPAARHHDGGAARGRDDVAICVAGAAFAAERARDGARSETGA